MPRVPSTSPATGLPVPEHYIHTLDASFVDTKGRTLLLRGVNLSGASKAPVGHLSHLLDDFWEGAEAGGEGFVGRPLNLDDGSADLHLARLRGWGFNMLRFPITWEALEHEGPGKYDYEFMDYTIRVLQKCKDYGFRVFMDPHQDTWSRYTGGSGAPYWTLAACGINPSNITATQSAIVHCEYPYAHAPEPADLPAMIWSTNYGRLLSQTIFTFFFAGKTFAPNCIIDGVNIQDYLQNHYIEAFGQLADRIHAYDERNILEGNGRGRLYDECVIGWDSMNEPFEGLVGWPNLNENPKEQGSTLKKGTYPTPAQSLRLGMGEKQTVENWSFGAFGPSRNGSVTIDPKGNKVWVDTVEPEGTTTPAGGSGASPSSSSTSLTTPIGELPSGYHPRWGWTRDSAKWKLGTCPWAQHGVWDIQTGYILRPDYFRFHPETGVEVEFIEDFWKVHFVKWKTRIERVHKEAVWFIQPPVFVRPPCLQGCVGEAEGGESGASVANAGDSDSTPPTGESAVATSLSEPILSGRACYSCHYYDGLTLITRHWNWFNADALGVLRGKYSNILQSVKIGEGAIRRSLREQLGILKEDALIIGGGVPPSSISSSTASTSSSTPTPIKYPTLIGEIGTPFDMDSKRAYGWTDKGKYKHDYSSQVKALDASLNACDGGNALNFTVWTFVGDDHSHEWGDGWNLEDLSLWSLSDVWGFGAREKKGARGAKRKIGRSAKAVPRLEEQANAQSVPSLLEGQANDTSLVNRKRNRNVRKDSQQQMKPSLAMVAAASSLSVASLGSMKTGSTLSADVVTVTDNSQPRVPPSRSSSTVSLAKAKIAAQNASASSLSLSSVSSIIPFYKKFGYHTNPFDFLNDGARAVKAFCRPYPVKTVGVVKELDFDISKASLKVGVSVGWEDGLAFGEAADGERIATEIFLPLVHFVHPRFLEESPAPEPQGVYRLSGSSVTLGSGKANTAPEDAVATLPLDADPLVSAPNTTGSLASDAKPVAEGQSDGQTKYRQWEDADDLLDVEVVVSEGRWEIRGQTLFWYYEVPEGPVPGGIAGSSTLGSVATTATSSSVSLAVPGRLQLDQRSSSSRSGKPKDDKTGAKEVKIEIRRKGGAVKQSVVDERRKKYEALWEEELCGERSCRGGGDGDCPSDCECNQDEDRQRDVTWCERMQSVVSLVGCSTGDSKGGACCVM